MEDMDVLVSCEDALRNVSLRLEKLNTMIMFISEGMQQEQMEQQVVGCVEGISYCVNDIKSIANEELQQLQKLQDIREK